MDTTSARDSKRFRHIVYKYSINLNLFSAQFSHLLNLMFDLEKVYFLTFFPYAGMFKQVKYYTYCENFQDV